MVGGINGYLNDADAAAGYLKQGLIGVFPTDTVYAIGCSAYDPKAIAELNKVRGRDQHKAYLIHVADLQMLSAVVARIPVAARTLINSYWPGPLTIVFPERSSKLPDEVAPGRRTIAVRWPDNELELAMIRFLGEPVVAPSANPPNRPPATTVSQAYQYFKNNCAFYLDGGTTKNKQVSTIVSIENDTLKIIRQGELKL
jgi:L-threonylcarbamoyladenylate synthase